MFTRGPGRPAKINRVDIERAVLTLGFTDASTTAIARHLGVDQSSLYRHIGSRRELLRGAVDRAIAENTSDFSHSTWRNYLTGLAEREWSFLAEHRGIAGVLQDLEATPPSGIIRLLEESVQVLHKTYDWPIPDALLILDTLMDMTIDTVNRTERLLAKVDATDLDTAAGDLLRHSELSTDITGTLSDIIETGLDQWWRRKVELLLDGAERLAPHHGGTD
ncbi:MULTISPECIES: TetR/AcrR family transcriptional regulator [unclassified Corynebacterium]|uniref:TetR/AcrR family transcriptional regulator n=1 Tax=unclassified Corynebacterium TaxID=2624378 RepID=UPI0035258AFB